MKLLRKIKCWLTPCKHELSEWQKDPEDQFRMWRECSKCDFFESELDATYINDYVNGRL